MNVAEILAVKGSEVATIGADRPIIEAVRLLVERRVGALVVSDDGRHIDGVISERDIVRHVAEGNDLEVSAPVSSVMSTDVRTCAPTDRVESLMVLMTERRIRHLPVRGHDEELCGIISIGDVVKTRVNELEAEHDQLVEYVRSGQ